MPHSLHFHKLYSFGVVFFSSVLSTVGGFSILTRWRWFFFRFVPFIHSFHSLCLCVSVFRIRMAQAYTNQGGISVSRANCGKSICHTLRSSTIRHCNLFFSSSLVRSLARFLAHSFPCIFSVHAATAHKVHFGCAHCTHTHNQSSKHGKSIQFELDFAEEMEALGGRQA